MRKPTQNYWLTFGFLALSSACSAQLEHRGIVHDATTRHLVVAGGMTPANLAAAERDPRVMMKLQLHQKRADQSQWPLGEIPELTGHYGESAVPASSIKVQGKAVPVPAAAPTVDWTVPLGAGTVGPDRWPAKYGFYVDDTPDCVNDYVVFALNVSGVTGGQANLVGINQLYSGNPAGICGSKPHVNWAYNGSTAGGATLGSPTLSLDGTKIVYIEVTTSSSILHVLTWKAGQGTSATHAATPTLVGKCTATSSCLTSLTYSSTSTTSQSFVYVDYSSDKGYVASDDGNIYRISCTFKCALNANPVVDWVFTLPVAGTGGALPVPTTPIYDGSTYLFVADQLGEVWSINASGTEPVLAAGPVMVGGGGCTTASPPGRTGGEISQPCTANGGSYGIPDGTMLMTWGPDGDEVFVTSGNDGVEGASAVVVELNSDLIVQAKDTVGIGSVGNTTTNVDLRLGDFDNTFINGESALGHYFMCGTGKTAATSTQPWDYWIGFTNFPVMNSTPTQAPYVNLPVSGAPCTELEEFYNPNINLGGNSSDHDMLLGGVIDPNYGPLILDNISNGTIATPVISPPPMFPGGISQFVVDNISTEAQASNWYFSTLMGIPGFTGCSSNACAVKVHQSTLQ